MSPTMMRRTALCLALATIAALGAASLSAQDGPELATLLERSRDYSVDFVSRFANVVAEEEYIQTWRSMHRTLTSDFLFVKDANGDYLAFRDVFKVDGRALRDHDERITKLFLSPSTDAADRAAEIAAEGARHTFGNFFNNPVMVLSFLQPRFQSRFRYSLGRQDRSLGPDVWVVDFREQDRPTIFRGPNDSDLPAAGSFWIEALTGRVVKTELQLANDTVTATFKFDERFQIDVPAKMSDRYRYMNNIVTGEATYGRFRRFAVETDETIPIQ
jgi:hypothetical protein